MGTQDCFCNCHKFWFYLKELFFAKGEKGNKGEKDFLIKTYAPVAQLDRAMVSEAIGRRFESSRGRQFFQDKLKGVALISRLKTYYNLDVSKFTQDGIPTKNLFHRLNFTYEF